MINIYVRLIEAGKKTLFDVKNLTMREKVKTALIADGCIINEDGTVTIE